ncbi:MAG: hypothetical protein J1E37_04680 [Prevotella sp.]|nr:hypothetical protein [Prevotella sp.]
MKTKRMLLVMAVVSMFVAPQQASAQFLKQLGKAAENLGKSMLESATTPSNSTSSTSTSQQSTNKQSSSKGQSIVTGHPDFKIAIKRCAASGTTVVLDLVVTNVGDNDVESFEIYGSAYGNATKVYDNLGNVYENDIYTKIANKEYVRNASTIKLVSNLPTNLSIKIENVSTKATSFVLVEPHIYASAWGTKPGIVKLRNIPITREEE